MKSINNMHFDELSAEIKITAIRERIYKVCFWITLLIGNIFCIIGRITQDQAVDTILRRIGFGFFAVAVVFVTLEVIVYNRRNQCIYQIQKEEQIPF